MPANNAFPDTEGLALAPNPAYGGQVTVRYRLLADADEVKVRLYSSGMTLAWDSVLGPRRAGWNGDALVLPELSNQIYFLVLETRQGDFRHAAPAKALVVLR